MRLTGIARTSRAARRRRTACGVLAGLAIATVGIAQSPSALAVGARAFAGGPLPPAQTVNIQHNRDVEPGIAVTPDGTFWIASTINADPRSGTGGLIPAKNDPLFGMSGSDIWRSSDAGATYQWVAAPFNLLPGRPGLGGADTDIAVATSRNSSGHYNVYAASLWIVTAAAGVAVGDISVAISQDGGKTWLTDVVAADVPLDDRPWLSADGACTLYLTYHQGPTVNTVVDRYDLCDPVRNATGLTLVPVASTRLLSNLVPLATGKPGTYVLGSFARPAVDTALGSQHQHTIYMPAMDCPSLTLADDLPRATGSPDCPKGKAEVFIFRSRDQGLTWSLIPVAASTGNFIRTWQVWAATDSAGSVYLTWSDTRNVYLDVSHDGGSTWSPPRLVNRAPSLAAVFPTLDAAGHGTVEVAWYGAPVAGASDDTGVFGNPGAPRAVPWSVFSARSTDGGVSFDQVQATGTVHTGKACTFGSGCKFFTGERDLLDDFGVAISPTTGLASIAYTSDQPEGDIFHDYTGYATETGPGYGVLGSRAPTMLSVPGGASTRAAGSTPGAPLPNTAMSGPVPDFRAVGVVALFGALSAAAAFANGSRRRRLRHSPESTGPCPSR